MRGRHYRADWSIVSPLGSLIGLHLGPCSLGRMPDASLLGCCSCSSWAVFPLLWRKSFLGHPLFGGACPLDRSIGTGTLLKLRGAFDELYWFVRRRDGHWKCWRKGVGLELFLIACSNC